MSKFLIICGAGAAGTGVAVAAIQHEHLDVLIKKGGIHCLERSSVVGGGMFNHLSIPANSCATVFLECIEGLKEYLGKERISRLLSSDEYQHLHDTGAEIPASLTEIGEWNSQLGEEIWKYILQSSDKNVLSRTVEVISVHVVDEKSTIVKYKHKGATEISSVAGEKVFLTMGGKQTIKYALSISVGNTTLNEFQHKVVLSHAFLLNPLLLLLSSHKKVHSTPANEEYTKENPIVIIGGSHSAWSCAISILRLSKKLPVGEESIVLLHRSSIKLYFASEENAQRCHYSYDKEKDVCPVTGRVFRYGGLRGPSKSLAENTVLKKTENRIKTIYMGDTGADEIEKILSSSSKIIVATGYAANVPKIFDHRGEKISLKTQNGQLIVNENGQCLLEADGSCIPQLYAFGLGSGLFVNTDVGGEKSFKGRADGVWLYQNDVGNVVLNSAHGVRVRSASKTISDIVSDGYEGTLDLSEKRSAVWRKIYSKKGELGLVDTTTPLHVLGGYDMFTMDQWTKQVDILIGQDERKISFEKHDRVLEIGIGSGAFINAMNHLNEEKELHLYGIDYCTNLIQTCRARINGTFEVCDATYLQPVSFLNDKVIIKEENKFPVVVSFGVTQYLNSYDDAFAMLSEMFRVSKDKSTIYVGEISDLSKKDLADKLRGKTHTKTKKVSDIDTSHLYFTKQWWMKKAYSLGASYVTVVDHVDIDLQYPTAAYRYSVYIYRK